MVGLNPTLVERDAADLPGLLELARAGDSEAFGEVYRAYATPLLRQAVAWCGDTTQAEELAADTLVEAWKHLHRYNGRCKFFTWLCAILLNRYRNNRRGNRVWFSFNSEARASSAAVHALAALRDDGHAPDEAIQAREQAALLRQCIASLPLKHQQVIHLRFYVDDSLEGIATALGCSVGTVKSRLFHALEKLRAMNALTAPFAPFPTKGGPP